MKKIVFLTVVLVFSIMLPCFAADDVGNQIKSLQQQMTALREGSIQSNNNAAQAIAALQELQIQYEALKASIDANSHLIRITADNLNLKMQESEARVGALEERLKIQGKQVASAVSTVAPEAAAEAELYQAGLNQINNSEFLKAIATFKKFMKKFPDSEYAASAQYWIGECYFAMRDYEQAIKEFQVLKDNYRKSDKIPPALLKQGYSFIELDMESDARLFLNELIKKYPSTKESKEAKERLQRMQDLKDASKKKAESEGEVPLAPGVAVPDDTKKFSEEKYR